MTTRIDAASPPRLPSLAELSSYREFLKLLIWREVYLRYRYTIVGIGWVVVQPLIMMMVFTLVVPRLIGEHATGLPYSLFAYCGLVPWTCFAHSATRSSLSLVEEADLIRNMYFPTILLPLAATLAALLDMTIAATMLLPMMLFYGVSPTGSLLALPFFLVMLTIINLGLGLLLAVLHVVHRDFTFLAQFIIQMGLLVTPVWFPLNRFPKRTQALVALNPMAGVVEGFRWSVVGRNPPPPMMIMISATAAVVLMLLGLSYFRSQQDTLADVI